MEHPGIEAEELTVVDDHKGISIIRRTDREPTGECIISAHGIQPWVNHKHAVPDDMMCVFYAPHGYTMSADTTQIVQGDLKFYKAKGNLLEPNTLPIMQGIKGIKEEKNPQKCQDYELSRFQEKGSIESVESLRDLARQQDEGLAKYRGIQQNFNTNVETYLDKYGRWMDIVVIQENNNVMLSEVLPQLKGLNYKRVHCSFCRGGQLIDWGKYDTIKRQNG